MSKESLEKCHFRGGKDSLAIYTNNYPDSKLFKGKGLTLGGSHKIDNFNNQSYYGDLSAILIENLPFWTDFIRTPSHDVALMDRWEEKLEKIARETVKENVTSIAGVPSWNLVMLKYILEYTGKKHILEVWPNLELFMHGGVSFEPYRQQFRDLIPTNDMHFQEAYNASEGFFAIQDDPQRSDMLLMLDYGIFYEFVPMDELENENPKAYTIGEVQKGINYAVVISTNSGLWRYLIGDTVQFTSLFPHKIKISGRTKHFINVFGEEVIRACKTCYLAMSVDDRPYVLPMNFALDGDTIILHSAQKGRMWESILKNPQVSINWTLGEELAWQDVQVGCSYRVKSKSVLVEGKVEIIEDYEEKYRCMQVMSYNFV